MCFKCPDYYSPENTFILITGRPRYGKTLGIAQQIVNCDDIKDMDTIPSHLSDWAEYFFGNRPITKADLREALSTTRL
jgi:hypothetical protein